jgi:hypothetical protein
MCIGISARNDEFSFSKPIGAGVLSWVITPSDAERAQWVTLTKEEITLGSR